MKILKTSEEIQEAIKENDMILLYFGAETCSVCVDMKPKVLEILEKYPKIKSFYIDAHASRKLSAEYNIFTVPVISVYAEAKEVIRDGRVISVTELDRKIERYYELLFQ